MRSIEHEKSRRGSIGSATNLSIKSEFFDGDPLTDESASASQRNFTSTPKIEVTSSGKEQVYSRRVSRIDTDGGHLSGQLSIQQSGKLSGLDTP